MDTIYENIFDAIRAISPNSPLIQLSSGNGLFFRRTDEYEMIDMGDYFAAFPGFPFQLFRGENKLYNTCKASIFRSGDPDDVIVDELRIIEFKNILLTFPQVQYAIEDNMKVDFLALAQHYELNTNLIDVTSEVEIAAYFATHRWINGIATPVEDGIGCIRVFASPTLTIEIIDPRFHMIGLQCFKRPGIQAAYGFEMDSDEDLSNRGNTICFKQNSEASRLIHTNFHVNQAKVDRLRAEGAVRNVKPEEIIYENSWLFPDEKIADVAKLIKNSSTISRAALDEYDKPCEEALKRKGIAVVNEPVYTLSEEHRKELDDMYRNRPYGDVQLKARMVLRK